MNLKKLDLLVLMSILITKKRKRKRKRKRIIILIFVQNQFLKNKYLMKKIIENTFNY